MYEEHEFHFLSAIGEFRHRNLLTVSVNGDVCFESCDKDEQTRTVTRPRKSELVLINRVLALPRNDTGRTEAGQLHEHDGLRHTLRFNLDLPNTETDLETLPTWLSTDDGDGSGSTADEVVRRA